MLMTMHKALHPRDNIGYVSRKEGRGLTRIKDCIYTTIWEVEVYTKKSKETLITAPSNCNINLRTNIKTIKSRKLKWEEKQLIN